MLKEGFIFQVNVEMPHCENKVIQITIRQTIRLLIIFRKQKSQIKIECMNALCHTGYN